MSPFSGIKCDAPLWGQLFCLPLRSTASPHSRVNSFAISRGSTVSPLSRVDCVAPFKGRLCPHTRGLTVLPLARTKTGNMLNSELSLYIDSGTWKNAELFLYILFHPRLWDLGKCRSLPLYIGLGTWKNSKPELPPIKF